MDHKANPTGMVLKAANGMVLKASGAGAADVLLKVLMAAKAGRVVPAAHAAINK